MMETLEEAREVLVETLEKVEPLRMGGRERVGVRVRERGKRVRQSERGERESSQGGKREADGEGIEGRARVEGREREKDERGERGARGR